MGSEGQCGCGLIYDITTFQVVQLVLYVVDVLIDLLHPPAVPHDLILVDLGGDAKPSP